jgi:serine/threonine-protein kinase
MIGEGGMGAVFSATHVITGRRLAVKWMLPDVANSEDARQRLVREAQAAGRINHPNVVDVYDVGEHEGSPFLVMELLQGETLTTGLERGALKIPEIVSVLVSAIEGVAAAHHQGVIHRDIKPDNIFLCRDAQGALITAKVLDFGISKVSSMGGVVNPRLTKTGAVMGTPYYMSPEQIRGVAEIDARVDIYAFGVILYEALTGRVPFDGKTYSALVLEIATGTPARPCAVNPRLVASLERVILKAMSREPEQRYQNMDSLAKALAPFETGGSGVSSDASLASELGRTSGPSTTPFASEVPPVVPVRRTPMYVAAIGGALALAVGVVAWVMQDDGDAEQDASAAAASDPISPSLDPVVAGASATPQVAPQAELVPPLNAMPDAGLARAPGTPETEQPEPEPEQPAQPSPPSPPSPTRPSAVARDRDRGEPSPVAEPVREDSTRPKGSGRSGTITADDF